MAVSNCDQIKITVSREDIYEVPCTGIEAKPTCLIICNWGFGGQADLPAYKKDLQRMRSIFDNFGFNVEEHENKTAIEMKNIIQVVRNRLNQKNNKQKAFVCILMSHGSQVNVKLRDSQSEIELDGETCIVGIDYKPILVVREILQKFNNENCKNFAMRPKLFFILSCRGANIDFGINITEHDGLEPTWTDLFVCYATIPGYVSWVWTDENKGSLVGQAIADELEHCENKELSHILTKATEKVRHVLKNETVKQSLFWEARGWRKLFYFKLNFKS